jgi:RNA polymerase sigma factor (sigma-70 family)
VPVIAAIARQQGLPPDRADDAVQDTLMTIHRARATYDPRLRFLPWLHAIARRRSIDLLRRHGRNAGREVHDPAAYEGHADAAIDAGEAVDRRDRGQALRAAVSQLPAGQRQAVERLALGEQSLDQAAAETGRNKVALKVNLHRAIHALRARLKQPGEDDT